MKIALYIEDGLEQIVLTPESDTEKGILGKLHDGSRELSIKRGSFFHCIGGWQRYTPAYSFDTYGGSSGGDESTMIVLRAASVDRSPEGQDAAGGLIGEADESAVPNEDSADAPTPGDPS